MKYSWSFCKCILFRASGNCSCWFKRLISFRYKSQIGPLALAGTTMSLLLKASFPLYLQKAECFAVLTTFQIYLVFGINSLFSSRLCKTPLIIFIKRITRVSVNYMSVNSLINQISVQPQY